MELKKAFYIVSVFAAIQLQPAYADQLSGNVSETGFKGIGTTQDLPAASQGSHQLPAWFGVADPLDQEQPLQSEQIQTIATPKTATQGQVQASLSSISLAPQMPEPTLLSKLPLSTNIEGGQNEYNVNWNAWRHRICDTVWDYVYAHRLIFWGMTRVGYNVTRDGHIQITSVFTPDPTGRSAKILVAAIMRLEGTPTLEFPRGSKQTIHHNNNMAIGLPLPSFTSNLRKLYLRGGTEHVTEQW